MSAASDALEVLGRLITDLDAGRQDATDIQEVLDYCDEKLHAIGYGNLEPLEGTLRAIFEKADEIRALFGQAEQQVNQMMARIRAAMEGQ